MEEDAARARDEEVINLGMDAPLNFSANAERELAPPGESAVGELITLRPEISLGQAYR